MKFSFVIPAFNEDRYIGRCLQSIHAQMAGEDYEIIVVDNASTDSTPDIAVQHGVTLLTLPHKYTISAVRNHGVEHSSGDILVFIDGDVYLHDTWRDNLDPVIESITSHPAVAGSVYAVDPNASWVAKVWFGPLFQKQQKVTFINGGHLLITRDLFDRIGGFDIRFETGEDHEFCERARAHGADVFNEIKLVTVHLGYPNTVGHFFRRERWHGKGNFTPISRIFASKIPIFVLMLLAAFLFSLIGPWVTGWWPAILAYPIFALALSTLAAHQWLGGFRRGFVQCMFLSWLYFTARGFSFIDVLRERLVGAAKTN
ncbi:PGL/p-HBAD biosynthesis glycosyltransferase/MT3031 [Rubripirellula lacrimiformis]|uniref:PGL/p-HBAD biosynthesis glycosyltransferase/MT3031 n=1 Tax=Rubripirellula lacrimiformis TaxID=1930273 RepID=A0A517N8F2_9BACT|nr:glycosyltransferase [Rubripirellula lacrimiformis]QDT03413.1 PGL/p-HBAD biosynthesis glycosyltransferase/MT3031 [Rubripirellula lacrimiformis]